MAKEHPTHGDGQRTLAHEVRQPLNVVQLACGNIRARILPVLGDDQADYLEGKLARIEQQLERLVAILDQGLSPKGQD